MKKSLLFAAVLGTSFLSFAQKADASAKNNRLKLYSAGIDIGSMFDQYAKMNLEAMYDLTKNPSLLERDLTGYEGSLYRNSSGVRLGANVSFVPYRSNHEIRFGISYSNREPLISYDRNEGDGSYSSIIYCNMVNEVNINGAYLIRKSPERANWFNYYIGIGASLGSSFNDQMVIIESSNNQQDSIPGESTTSFYEGKSSFFTRIYAPVGIDVTILKHFRLGLEGNLSVGMQNVYGGKTYFMPFGGGFTTKLTWVF